MFHVRFEKWFLIGAPSVANDRSRAGDGLQQAPGEQHLARASVATSAVAALRLESTTHPKPPWMQQPTRWTPQTSADSAATVATLPGPVGRLFGRKKKIMTSICVNLRKRVADTDCDFEFDVWKRCTCRAPPGWESSRLGWKTPFLASTAAPTFWRDLLWVL